MAIVRRKRTKFIIKYVNLWIVYYCYGYIQSICYESMNSLLSKVNNIRLLSLDYYKRHKKCFVSFNRPELISPLANISLLVHQRGDSFINDSVITNPTSDRVRDNRVSGGHEKSQGLNLLKETVEPQASFKPKMKQTVYELLCARSHRKSSAVKLNLFKAHLKTTVVNQSAAQKKRNTHT